jgi:hypothetical protein
MDASDGHRLEEEAAGPVRRVLTLGEDESNRLAEAMHEATGQHLCGAELALKRLQLIAEPEVIRRSRRDRRGHQRCQESIQGSSARSAF